MADRFESGRMEAFSDGVFAIAITLLVLDISVPARAFEDLWAGIADQWPSYLAYATSFFTIGGLWVVHHGLSRRLRYANVALMRLNSSFCSSSRFCLSRRGSWRRRSLRTSTPSARPSSSTGPLCW
jgi:uncharacterized membrane protein